ncbi:MAG: hypothetical protein LBC10_01910 [Deltaproteobacteria bacterium]|jgi:hypothetical protein|nr:hypothetical protein [Deltaproteobacteria bacterium]
MIRLPVRALCCFAALLVLGGCAPQHIALTPASPDTAASTWTAFADYCADQAGQTGPYLLQCGLRYTGTEDDGNRAKAVFWGNSDRLIRLDIMAGIGMLVGRVLQNETDLVIHSPRENKAWTYHGRGKALLSFGVPIPLTLQDVVAVMQGRYLDVFGPAGGVDPYEAEQGAVSFRLEGGRLPGTVTLDPDGLLTRWQEAPGAWSMRIEYDRGLPCLPREIAIDHPGGGRAVLTVTSRQRPAAPFSEEQLRLELPPGTAIEAMRRAGSPQTEPE